MSTARRTQVVVAGVVAAVAVGVTLGAYFGHVFRSVERSTVDTRFDTVFDTDESSRASDECLMVSRSVESLERIPRSSRTIERQH